jgi:hypothetical protein
MVCAVYKNSNAAVVQYRQKESTSAQLDSIRSILEGKEEKKR